MNTKILFSLTILLITNVSISQNLLNNGDFESGDKTGWIAGKNFAIQSTDKNGGNYAAELSGDSYTNQSVAATDGKTYRLKGYAKSSSATQGAYLSFQYQNNGVWTYINYAYIKSNDWTEYNVVLNLEPGQSNKFRVGLRKLNSGSHYFDDIEVTEITDPSSLNTENDILSTTIGTLNSSESKIEDIPLETVTATDLINALSISQNATIILINDKGLYVTPETVIDGSETIKVFAENGVVHTYTLTVNDSSIISVDSDEAELDNINYIISKITPVLTVAEFVDRITIFESASLEVLDATTKNVVSNQSNTIISESMILKVTGLSNFTEYKLQLRAIEMDNKIVSIRVGSINEITPAVENIPQNIIVGQLKNLIKVAKYATLKITNDLGVELEHNDIVSTKNQVRVIAENGDFRIYEIVFGSTPITNITYTDQNVNETELSNTNIILEGTSELKITNTSNAFNLASVNLNSEDCWLMFENIIPSVVRDTYLKDILAYGQPAVLDQNVRIVQYVNGAVVIPHAPNYEAVEVFDGPNLTGNSMKLTPYTYNKIAQLGVFNDAIASFKVKRGYYVTMAQNENGTGFSKVFLAHDADLIVNTMPNGLEGKVSFARVIPWRWPNKKGHPNNDSPKFNGGWKYNWNANGTSTLDVEYVPIKHKISWPSLNLINNKKDSPNMLGHNEPNAKEQANASIEQVLAQWPKLMESGLRLGSPAPTDGGLSSWLYPFIDRCDELNYRVDFVAIHYYRGCNTINGQGIYNFAKAVHERTGRPIWITEFSNGAPWSSCTPDTQAEHAAGMKEMIKRLEEAPFVERYCIFPYFWPFNKTLNDGALTETGIVYRDQVSHMAYNPVEAYNTTYEPLTPPSNLTATFDANAEEVDLTWNITADIENGFILERSIDGGGYQQIAEVKTSGVTTYTDKDILFSGEYSYRIKSINGANTGGASNSATVNVTVVALVNIAKNKAVSIESNATETYDHHAAYVPAGATDEDYTTNGRWLFRFDKNGGLPVTLEIDLVDNYRVDAYKMVEDNKATKSYKIEYWDATSTSWKEIASITNNSSLTTTGSFATRPITNKVRVVFLSSNDSQYIRLKEIEIFGVTEASLSSVENKIENVSLYPNPVKNQLLHIKGISDVSSAIIYNMLGVKQKSSIVNNKIDVQHLASGLYMVVINNKRVGKFMKL